MFLSLSGASPRHILSVNHLDQTKVADVNSRGSSNSPSNDSFSFTRVSRSGFAGGNSIARVVHAVISRLQWLPEMVDRETRSDGWGIRKKLNTAQTPSLNGNMQNNS